LKTVPWAAPAASRSCPTTLPLAACQTVMNAPLDSVARSGFADGVALPRTKSLPKPSRSRVLPASKLYTRVSATPLPGSGLP